MSFSLYLAMFFFTGVVLLFISYSPRLRKPHKIALIIIGTVLLLLSIFVAAFLVFILLPRM